MEMAEPAVPNGPLQLITYCPKHCKPQVGATGEALLQDTAAHLCAGQGGAGLGLGVCCVCV